MKLNIICNNYRPRTTEHLKHDMSWHPLCMNDANHLSTRAHRCAESDSVLGLHPAPETGLFTQKSSRLCVCYPLHFTPLYKTKYSLASVSICRLKGFKGTTFLISKCHCKFWRHFGLCLWIHILNHLCLIASLSYWTLFVD